MQNLFIKKEKASLSTKIFSLFFVAALLLPSFSSIAIAEEENVVDSQVSIVSEPVVETTVEPIVVEPIVEPVKDVIEEDITEEVNVPTTNPQYGNYCGDGLVNQDWEACDVTDSLVEDLTCTNQCQMANVCSEKAFARVVVPEGGIKNWRQGTMTSDVFVGGSDNSNKIPQGAWFEIFDGTNWVNDNVMLDPAGTSYEDVPGFGIQRGNNFVKLVVHTPTQVSTDESLAATTGKQEHADGYLEFFGTNPVDTNPQVSELVSDGNDNVENIGIDALTTDGFTYNAGKDALWMEGNLSKFWLTVGRNDDAFSTILGDTNICESEPVCDPNVNLVKNGSFENPGLQWDYDPVTDTGYNAQWGTFASGTPLLEWMVSWLNPAGAPETANIEIQHSGLFGTTANTGNQWAELDSDWRTGGINSASTKIYQDVATIPGQKYILKFAHAPRPGTEADQNKIKIEWDNSFLGQFNMIAGVNPVSWTNETYNGLIANPTGNTTTLAFSDAGISNSFGTYVDSVEVYCDPNGGNGGWDDRTFCETHPEDITCQSGGTNFCIENPTDPSCITTGGGGEEETCDQNPDQDKCDTGGGTGGGSNHSGSYVGGRVLGELALAPTTPTVPGQVLGASLAQTGTDVSPMIYLGMTMLGLLFITRRKAFKF